MSVRKSLEIYTNFNVNFDFFTTNAYYNKLKQIKSVESTHH